MPGECWCYYEEIVAVFSSHQEGINLKFFINSLESKLFVLSDARNSRASDCDEKQNKQIESVFWKVSRYGD